MTGSPSALSRRAALGAGAAALAFAALPAAAQSVTGALSAAAQGVKPDAPGDQSAALQRAIAAAVKARLPLYLPPGSYRATGLDLSAGAGLVGVPGATRLLLSGTGPLIAAQGGEGLRLEGLTLDGSGFSIPDGSGLIALARCAGIRIRDCVLTASAGHGIALAGCGGEVANCRIATAAKTGLFAIDSTGLAIRANEFRDIGNNAVQVWRSQIGDDGTLVLGNRISRVAANDSGDGQNGNGVNVFRAGNVIVADNRIADCAFSAVRGNAASNLMIRGNNCSTLGETGLYAEFGFHGAIISANVVENAVNGIAVTNFDQGGRLAVVEGNIVRNMLVKAPPDYDSPISDGIGISVEADTAVTGNVVENAPKIGIRVGFGAFARNVAVVGNVVRNAGVGIGAAIVDGAGDVLIADNLVTGAKLGAVVGLEWNKPATGDLAGPNPGPLPLNLAVSGNRVR
ncbi:TIGR03808 family TAT-translocated repetitive protein [Ancylobacter terrae]|uniref:TIGR03808 family TAT-translocated repetitive protein n=1 Tax=Ancylobacter sp. sgz301288 TaxID=3342077 RepID=UPI00385E73BE